METIAVNPTEQHRLPTVRPAILYRDRYCTFPYLVNNKLAGMYVTGPAKYGNVHHITPMDFLVRHRPQVDPNHPLNLFTLDRERHNILHREWVNRYGKNPELIRHEVKNGGKAGWVDEYDDALASIALIRSYDLIMVEPQYFTEYQGDIIGLRPFVDGNFEDRYRFFEKQSF